ncbi:MAG: 50S ribosomal protein L25 [Candidatus Shapirobacteria bacterium]|jgi:large subunit ribosomal protein L25
MAKIGHQIEAKLREVKGKKVKNLRNQGLTPSTVYGKGMESISISVDSKILQKTLEEVGSSGLVNLKVEDKEYPIMFRNPQYHPVEGNVLHVDCYKVNLKEKIKAMVPIELVGESSSVKNGNVLVEVANEIEVEGLPTDLPERIEVDITKLAEVDAMITVADLIVDTTKITILTDMDQVIVKTEEPKIEEEPVATEAVEPGAVPATEQKTPEEKEAEEKAKAEEKKEEK